MGKMEEEGRAGGLGVRRVRVVDWWWAWRRVGGVRWLAGAAEAVEHGGRSIMMQWLT